MILVTGATGNAGGAVARALIERGAPVRALIREGSSSSPPDGAEIASGDLNDPESVSAALDGVTAAFLLSGYDGLQQTLASMSAAGVERVVLLSSSAAPSGNTANAIARYHIESEAAVRESGLPWTFLQPDTFMTNTLRWLPQLEAGDVVSEPFADVAVATIDPADIGAVAALALTTSDHEGQAYRLSGPESLRPAERLEILGEGLGRPLRLEPQSDDEARAEMEGTMPAEYVDAFFNFFAEGALDESEVLPTVEEITGRPPGDYRSWVAANADRFR